MKIQTRQTGTLSYRTVLKANDPMLLEWLATLENNTEHWDEMRKLTRERRQREKRAELEAERRWQRREALRRVRHRGRNLAWLVERVLRERIAEATRWNSVDPERCWDEVTEQRIEAGFYESFALRRLYETGWHIE